MRAEIIIACRGELPANLHRTIQNLRDTIGDDDGISVIMDGNQSESYKLDWRVRQFKPWERLLSIIKNIHLCDPLSIFQKFE